MANVNLSPNMNLPVPVVGVDAGPDWATQLNNCMALIDQHTHTSGSGVPINPSGLNINADLSIGSNNLTLVRSTRYQVQPSVLSGALDLGCTYVTGVDLYFNDVSGNRIQITQSGGIAGSPGSISNLTSPASASYVAANQTFVWQSDVSTPANLDAGSLILRNILANSKGLTLAPPSAMASNYTITLPVLPGVTGNFVTMSTSGNMSATVNVDNATLQVVSNVMSIKTLGAGSVNTTQIVDGAVTQPKRAALGQQLSSSSGAFAISTATPTDVTNLSAVITTTGRPVFIGLIADGSGFSVINVSNTAAVLATVGKLYFVRGSITVAEYQTNITFSTALTTNQFSLPGSSFYYIDTPSAATYTYKLQVSSGTSNQITVGAVKLIVYEL